MTILWNIFLSPFNIVCNTFKYYKHNRKANAQVSSYADREWHSKKAKRALDDIYSNIPCVIVYICIQLLWYFIS